MLLRRLLNIFDKLQISDEKPRKKSKPPKIVISIPPVIIPIVPPPAFYAKELVSTHHETKSDESTHHRDRIPPEIRNSVWIKYHGEATDGICYCCGTRIQRYHAGWHCSHVLADSKNGEEIVENLRACCQHCNLSMGDQNLYVYIRDKKLTGPGAKNVISYLAKHPSQIHDVRTNNWGKSKSDKSKSDKSKAHK